MVSGGAVVAAASPVDAARKQKEQALALLEKLAQKAQELGAPLGAQRITLVRTHFEKLSAKEAYQWLDPTLLKREVEEGQTARADKWHLLRNIFSLLPLILTWLAITIAVGEYVQDVNAYQMQDQGQTFLILWQAGFHGADPLTFGVTGMIDVLLLGCCLLFLMAEQQTERKALRISNVFASELDRVTAELMTASDAYGSIMISSDVSGQTVAEAVQRVIDSAMRMTSSMTDRLDKLVEQLQSDLSSLRDVLHGSQQQMTELTGATSGLTGAADALAKNAGTYSVIGDSLRQHIAALDHTQSDVLTRLNILATGVQTAAGEIATVSKEITGGLKPSLTDMTTSVTDASSALSSVTVQLKSTSVELLTAAAKLSSVNIGVDELDRTQGALVTTLSTLGTSVSKSADSIEVVASAIASEMRPQIAQMTGNVSSATRDLQQYELRMVSATDQLLYAASSLRAAVEQLANIMGVQHTPVGPSSQPRKKRWRLF